MMTGESSRLRPTDECEDREGSYYSDDSSCYYSDHESEGSYYYDEEEAFSWGNSPSRSDRATVFVCIELRHGLAL